MINLFIGALFFSLFGVFARLLSSTMNVYWQFIIRVGIMSIIFCLIGYFGKLYKPINTKDWPLLIVRGMITIFDFLCFYYAVLHLPLGLSLFIFYASSVIISFLLGAIVLKETMNLVKVISLIMAILGLFIMNQEPIFDLNVIALITAIISGSCFGLTMTTSKLLTNKYDSMQINLIAFFVTFLLLIPLIVFSKVPAPVTISLLTSIKLVGFAIVAAGAAVFTINGYKKIEAQKASLIMLSELFFVVIIGYLFYNEIPSIQTIIGGIFVLVALALPNVEICKISKWKKL